MLPFSQACKLWKGFAPAQYGRAQLLLHEGKKDEALECLDLVLKELPDMQEALVLQGLLYSDKNDRKNALSKLKAALDINSTLCEAWITQAQIFQQVVVVLRLHCCKSCIVVVSHCLTGEHTLIYIYIVSRDQDTTDYGFALSSYAKALELLSKSPPNSLKQNSTALRNTKMGLWVNTAVLYDYFEKVSNVLRVVI